MHYIVFDLEWNQSPRGKMYSDSQLPFEIIEIGAVKLNMDLCMTETFHRLIKPQVYKKIHNSIHDVIHMDIRELDNGTPFPEAVQEFFEWCGEGAAFCTWGTQDVMEIQRNMKYYHLLDLLPGPVFYYDVQKLFALDYETPESRRSLQYAVDFLKIEKDHGFHRALEDAHFTAEVLQRINTRILRKNPSLDVYQHPRSKKEELFLPFPTCRKYVSREFISKEKAVKDREVNSTRCPVCGQNAKRKIRWFTTNAKVYYSLSICAEHGFVSGRIRLRKSEEEQYFAVKTLKNATDEEAEEIRERRNSLRLKKQSRKT